MADDAAVEKKRGRKAAVEDSSPKKKAKVDSKDSGATPAKRGRGRPKGSGKKAGGKVKVQAKSTPGKGRGGRPKKTDKKAESADEEEENDDEN